MREDVESIIDGEDRKAEHKVGQDDAAGVRQKQQREHVPEYWL